MAASKADGAEAEEVTGRATPSGVIDFDEMWEEKRAESEPLLVKVKGDIYELPAKVPAKVFVFAARLRRTKGTDAEASAEELLFMCEAMLGKENLDRILATDIELEELGDLVERIQKEYGERNKRNKASKSPAGSTAGKAPKARRPAAQKRTSTGR